MSVKKNHLVVIFLLFFVLLIVTFSCSGIEGYVSSTITGPNDNTLVINDDDEAVAVITDDNEVYINEQAIDNYDDASINTYYGPYGGSAAVAQGPDGNTAAVAQGPYGNTVVKGPAGNVAVSSDTNSQQSDYVLKSQIVPPVCPACPSLVAAADELNNSSSSSDDSNGDSSDDSNGSSSSSSDDTNGDSNGDTCTSESCYEGNTYKREVNVKCPPCPPCARCPEPAFDCKKVPSYKESDDRYLPRPVLNDFSTFGM